MQKTISAIKVRQNLGQVMNEVALKDDEYIVERAGKPLVAIIPIERYQGIKKERGEFFRMVEKIRTGIRPADDEVIDAEIEEAVKAVSAVTKRPTLAELSDSLELLPELGDDRKRFKKDLKELRRKQPQMPRGRKWE